jgi:Leucine-rich repeat (LRR) protein
MAFMRNSLPSHLNLWKKRLGRVPDSVWDRTELETLVLADNELSEMSEQIGRLKRLRMLDLGHNQLTRVPDGLADLDGLTDFLYLHDNRLTSLPSCLEKLTNLRYLNISENAFEVFPECVSSMSGLIELRVSDNYLTSLSNSIGHLSRIRELHLRNPSFRSFSTTSCDSRRAPASVRR